MSNTTVGGVYQQIIQDVIDASRIDFEEGGVDESILEELRKGWQQKLSGLKVANFPWDPKPEPAQAPPAAPAPPAVNNNQAYTQAQLSPSSNAQPLSLPAVQQPPVNQGAIPSQVKPEPGVKNEPLIKQEPGLPNGVSPQNQAFAGAVGPNNIAAQRAISQLNNVFGSRAAASISALHNQQNAMNGAQQRPQQGVVPGQPQPNLAAQQYQRSLANSTQQRMQHVAQGNGQNGVAPSQLDGAVDDFEGVLLQKGSDGKAVEVGRVDIDRMLHDKIAARAKRMEGGGLMLPLKQATKHSSSSKSTAGLAQLDGLDDDVKEEDEDIPDEDAINSDLDDPDDEQDDDDDDDDSMGHIMLCMYDKVQRVKNKWKCTLKDGVLTVNGKEYVFHKATGEYEW